MVRRILPPLFRKMHHDRGVSNWISPWVDISGKNKLMIITVGDIILMMPRCMYGPRIVGVATPSVTIILVVYEY